MVNSKLKFKSAYNDLGVLEQVEDLDWSLRSVISLGIKLLSLACFGILVHPILECANKLETTEAI